MKDQIRLCAVHLAVFFISIGTVIATQPDDPFATDFFPAIPEAEVYKGIRIYFTSMISQGSIIVDSDDEVLDPNQIRYFYVTLENVGESEVTVLKGSYDVTRIDVNYGILYVEVDRPERCLVTNRLIKPSLPDLRPVTLKPGEITNFYLSFRVKNDTKVPEQFIAVYTVHEEWSELHNVWTGGISGTRLNSEILTPVK
ncbi:MAG: hypothetical protein ACSHYA_06475 [Opitutaceae bacterium]